MGGLIKLIASTLLATGGVDHLQATITRLVVVALCATLAAVMMLGALGCLAAALWIDTLPSLGPVGAPLVVAAAFLIVALILVAVACRLRRPAGARRPRLPPQEHRWRRRSHVSSRSTKARCCWPRRLRGWPPPAAAASDDGAATRERSTWQLRRSAPRQRRPRPSPSSLAGSAKSGWRRCPCRGILQTLLLAGIFGILLPVRAVFHGRDRAADRLRPRAQAAAAASSFFLCRRLRLPKALGAVILILSIFGDPAGRFRGVGPASEWVRKVPTCCPP